MIKKTLALFLCLLMFVSIVPIYASAAEVVASISISGIKAPAAGEVVDYTCAEDTMGGDKGYYTYEGDDDAVKTFFGKTWYDKTENERPLNRGEKFIAGHSYIVAVSVIAKNGYEFKTESVPEEGIYSRVTASVNGEKAKVAVPSGYDPKKNAVVRYEFEVCPNRKIEDVFFPDIVVPQVGEKPNYTSSMDSIAHDGGFTSYEQLDDMQYTVYGKTWIDIDNDYAKLSRDDTFEAGHRYAIDIYVCPTKGCEFKSLSAINAKINGKSALVDTIEGYDYNEVIRLRYEFAECSGDAITSVAADITTPVAGEKADYAPTVSGNHYSLGDFRNPIYSSNGVMWFRADGDEAMVVGGADEIFEAGKSYTVKINFMPDDGYTFSDDLIVCINDNVAEVERFDDGSITAIYTFTVDDNDDGPVVYENPFTDVDEGKWYTEGILWCYKHGYMAGVSETLFGRKSNVTRAMFVTILAKIDGADTSSYTEMSFTDVPAGQWYSNSIEWAASNGYAAGIGGGQFGRKADVSREQITLFFYTYSSLNGIDVSNKADISSYTDLDSVHSWALDAVKWAVAKGLVTGVGENVLAPRASATRAEIALIVKNYVENILNAAKLDLTIAEQPSDYYMGSSMETADFTVKVIGGKAPYLYEWVVCRDNVEETVKSEESSSKINTLEYEFSDYDFDEVNHGIEVYCLITDANGNRVSSKTAQVDQYFPLDIVSAPANYYMTSSQEEAEFSVTVSGGKGPYTYKWTVAYDNDERVSESTYPYVTDHFTCEFSDYDFEEYRIITVWCEITDANGDTITTPYAEVFPKS